MIKEAETRGWERPVAGKRLRDRGQRNLEREESRECQTQVYLLLLKSTYRSGAPV